MLKILHTGDIHLDSAFSGLDSRHAEIRRNEIRASFSSMMTFARVNHIDMVLIAGDMFDGNYITQETLSLICREFERFEGPIFIAPGNHDPAAADSVWFRKIFPDNVHIFRESRLQSVELKIRDQEVCVYGYGFTAPSMDFVPFAGLHPDDSKKTNILLAHCDMIDRICCPATPADIESFGADYAALGHVHNPTHPGRDGRWCYCGCLEARAFDEIGPKGACVVEINKQGVESSVTIKKVRFSKRWYEKGELAVTGASSNAEIAEKIKAYIKERRYNEDILLALKLTGVIPQQLIIDTEYLEGSFPELFYTKIEDNTLPDIDPTSLEHDISITGALYRELKPSLESNDPRTRETALRALRYALAALSGQKTF